MFDDILEIPAAGSVSGRADSDDNRVYRPFANDALLAEIGLSVRAIRELRGFLPNAGADG